MIDRNPPIDPAVTNIRHHREMREKNCELANSELPPPSDRFCFREASAAASVKGVWTCNNYVTVRAAAEKSTLSERELGKQNSILYGNICPDVTFFNVHPPAFHDILPQF